MEDVSRGSGVLLIDARGWILLQLRDAHAAYPFHWATVGGGNEDGEEDEAAARRELTEETGYIVGALQLGARVGLTAPDGSPRVATLYTARYDGVQSILCLEGLRIDFIDPAALDALLIYPGQRGLIDAALDAASSAETTL